MICIAWSGFPQYAARCVGKLVTSCKEKVVVIGTTPDIPIKGMENLCGCPVHWIKENDKRELRELIGCVPDRLVMTGWGVPAFNVFRDEVRANGGRVVAMVDNDFAFSMKQCVKAVRFRLFLKRKYDGFLVPGESGVRLLRFYGVSESKIRIGMYAADATLFNNASNILQRPKKMIFVGRIDSRKNIVPFARAFLSIDNEIRKDWMLEISGCGVLKDQLPRSPALSVHDFVQPEELTKLYQTSRIFVLPSLEEHWGVVVHEAALSGCFLLLSNRIGAAADFAGKHNCVTFDPKSFCGMKSAIAKVLQMPDNSFEAATNESLSLSSKISIDRFVDSVRDLLGIE